MQINGSITCPHHARARQKLVRKEDGSWLVGDLDIAETILKNPELTCQAGFSADIVDKLPHFLRRPLVFLEGKEHQAIRRKSAPFFTPKMAQNAQKEVVEASTKALIEQFRRDKEADLGEMALRLSTQVVQSILGLDGCPEQFAKHLIAAIESAVISDAKGVKLGRQWLTQQWRAMRIYFMDLRSSVRKKKRERGEDLISHLIDAGYGDIDILTEVIMFGVAGVATVREFIAVTALHFFANPEIKAHFLQSDQAERYRLLHQILAAEPPIGSIHRRALQDIELEVDGETQRISRDEKIEFSIYGINKDPKLACPAASPSQGCPINHGKAAQQQRQAKYSFGAGHHRCPGEYVALVQSDVFLRALFEVPGLDKASEPELSFSTVKSGYSIYNLRVVCD